LPVSSAGASAGAARVRAAGPGRLARPPCPQVWAASYRIGGLCPV